MHNMCKKPEYEPFSSCKKIAEREVKGTYEQLREVFFCSGEELHHAVINSRSFPLSFQSFVRALLSACVYEYDKDASFKAAGLF